MINQDKLVNLINEWPSILKQGIKGPGTARGIMLIAGLILLGIFHPELVRQYSEVIAIALIYGATDILRKKLSISNGIMSR